MPEVEDVTLRFGGVTAISRVSFDVQPGELFAIIGPNGAGKTSIFNTISQVYKPQQGDIRFRGETLMGLRPDKVADAIVADLKEAQFGVQVGTTSLDAVESVIDPSQQPQVFNDSNDTVRALKSKQVEAIVVDLPTAIYLRDVEVEGSKVVGQFPAPGGDDWGVVLAKGSRLTPCVNEALGAMRASGELDQITEQWIGAEAPVLDLE